MLRKIISRRFTKMSSNYLSPNRPVQDRVMNTPSWPVPYYKRKLRAAPVQNGRVFDLEIPNEFVTDEDVIDLKNRLELDPSKREMIQAVEQNIKTDGTFRFLKLLYRKWYLKHQGGMLGRRSGVNFLLFDLLILVYLIAYCLGLSGGYHCLAQKSQIFSLIL